MLPGSHFYWVWQLKEGQERVLFIAASKASSTTACRPNSKAPTTRLNKPCSKILLKENVNPRKYQFGSGLLITREKVGQFATGRDY